MAEWTMIAKGGPHDALEWAVSDSIAKTKMADVAISKDGDKTIYVETSRDDKAMTFIVEPL